MLHGASATRGGTGSRIGWCRRGFSPEIQSVIRAITAESARRASSPPIEDPAQEAAAGRA